MRVVIDPKAGPCGGVRRAIRMVEKRLQDQEDIVAIGPLIHNNAEVARLTDEGLDTVQQDAVTSGDLEALQGKRAFIRSHGVSPALRKKLETAAAEIVDGTCPKVAVIQKQIQQQYAAGRQIVIIGKKGHPEVVGLAGHCDNKAVIISSEEDVQKIDTSRPIFLVSQTTISHGKFIDLKEKISHIIADLLVKDTVCRQVMNRHDDIRNFAASMDVLFLVGGKQSSNTAVLFEVAKAANPATFWIEEAQEISADWIKGKQNVGVSGSASTPVWQMEKIRDFLLSLKL